MSPRSPSTLQPFLDVRKILRLRRDLYAAEEVRALIAAGLADPDPYVSGQSEAAASDLNHFLNWKIGRDP